MLITKGIFLSLCAMQMSCSAITILYARVSFLCLMAATSNQSLHYNVVFSERSDIPPNANR